LSSSISYGYAEHITRGDGTAFGAAGDKWQGTSMIRKSGDWFSEKIMLKQKDRAR
jgi:hypothetical protein